MTWFVELPDSTGAAMLINLDAPVLVQPNGATAVLTTALGPVGIGLDYETVCARLRLNPADRIVAPSADQARRLGRTPARRDPRVPTLRAIAPTLPPAPDTFTQYVDAVGVWILGANDRVGDCTCVAPANIILALTTLGQNPIRIPDQAILDFYGAVSGYTPADPATDQGAAVEDVLSAWHARGLDGDKLDGFASLDLGDHEQVRQAIAHLGPIDLGVNLPEGWMRAASWDVSNAGDGVAGGHCVAAVGYDRNGPLVVSWGKVFTLSWAGWDAFMEEAHVLLSRDGLRASGRDAEGVDWTMLEQFMTAMEEAA